MEHVCICQTELTAKAKEQSGVRRTINNAIAANAYVNRWPNTKGPQCNPIPKQFTIPRTTALPFRSDLGKLAAVTVRVVFASPKLFYNDKIRLNLVREIPWEVKSNPDLQASLAEFMHAAGQLQFFLPRSLPSRDSLRTFLDPPPPSPRHALQLCRGEAGPPLP